MGWANDRFRAELEAAGIRGAGLSVPDYTDYDLSTTYEYCIYVDGCFRGGEETLSAAKCVKNSLKRYMPGHDVQIVALEVKNNHWKSKHFEEWDAIVEDENGKIHIYRKYLAPDLEFDHFKAAIRSKGKVLALFRKQDVVENTEPTRQFGDAADKL